MPAIKSKNWPLAPRDKAWDADAAEDRVRRWAGGPEKENIDWAKYRSCFMWYDDEDPENFGAYKLLYADIIDGEPHVVFRALAAIVAVLNGARGGVDLPRADREAVYREAEKQYRRFDEEPPELQRNWQRVFERRDYPFEEIRVEPGEQPKIVGYAAVFNKLSQDLGGFREVIAPGAFKKTLKEADVCALLEHDPRWLLGNSKSGTARLKEDGEGLRVEIDPPNTTAGKDAIESLQRGDLTGMSFGFRTIRDRWEKENGQTVRTLLEVALYDVSIVAYPAYPDTSVALRSAMAAGIMFEEAAEPVGEVGGDQPGHSVDHSADGSASQGPSLDGHPDLVTLSLKRKRLEIAEKAI